MKTSFFKSMKLLMFLLFVASSNYVGNAQTIQTSVIITPIGGSKNPDPGPYTNKSIIAVSNKFLIENVFPLEIGGRSSSGEGSVRKSQIEPIPVVSMVATGVRQNPEPVPIKGLS
ncbi:hypothetical protein [Flavobacterium terrisoli]|uniref:hypothetical protein n=1 Tax=Flavobacterium terrisoli TaxID=3242195 RepID=UPI002543F537|nr:hypothetical protein [Flavobacterium buctense]